MNEQSVFLKADRSGSSNKGDFKFLNDIEEKGFANPIEIDRKFGKDIINKGKKILPLGPKWNYSKSISN